MSPAKPTTPLVDFPVRRSLRACKKKAIMGDNQVENECPKTKTPVKNHAISKSPSKSLHKLTKALFPESPNSMQRSSPRKVLSELASTPDSNINLLETPTSKSRKQLFALKLDQDQTPTTTTPRSSPRKISSEATSVSNATSVKLLGTPTSSTKMQLFTRNLDPKVVKTKQALTSDDQIIGREKELEELNDFLIKALSGKQGKTIKRSLYISGPPGTGKTMCLKHVLNQTNGGLKAIFFNCMSVTNSKDIFLKIALAFNPRYDGNHPKKTVEARICSKSSKPTLLVLDEIDQLGSKGQEILYSIFEWPYLKNSKLILVGIANSLHLTDTTLTRLKLSESMNPKLMHFPAYTAAQIARILNQRLEVDQENEESTPIIKPMAIKFLAGKVANSSGDVRKALDVCRRAIEVTELKHQKQTILNPTKEPTAMPQIGLPEVSKVFEQVFYSQISSSIKDSNSDLPVQQKIILATMLLITNSKQTGRKEVTLGKLQTTHSRVCQKRRMTSSDISEILNMCALLEDRGLLNMKKNKNVRETKLSLRINENEVSMAMQDKNLFNFITSDHSCLE